MIFKIVYYFLFLLSLLPLRVLYILSDFFYLIIFYVIRYRRNTVHTNLVNSFPSYNKKQIRTIEHKYYHQMCDLFVETFKMISISEKEIKERCIFKNIDRLTPYFKQGRSILTILGHYGNWEWMASFALWIDPSIEFTPLYKPIRSSITDKIMHTIRARFHGNPIPKNDILRYMVNAKKMNQLYILAVIGDQTPNKRNLNYATTFLNQQTYVLLGTEKLATKFDLPVFCTHVTRPKRGYYEIEFILLTDHPKDMKQEEITFLHTRHLEQQIIERPELWLWSHKRWKHKVQND